MEERHRRFEYGRRRVLESPPRDQHHNYQIKSNYEREYHDVERQRYHQLPHQERLLPMKHKVSSDHDEPSNKRPRTESYHRHSEDESRWHRQRDPPHAHSLAEAVQALGDMSCQSPDYILPEPVPAPPVKGNIFVIYYLNICSFSVLS